MRATTARGTEKKTSILRTNIRFYCERHRRRFTSMFGTNKERRKKRFIFFFFHRLLLLAKKKGEEKKKTGEKLLVFVVVVIVNCSSVIPPSLSCVSVCVIQQVSWTQDRVTYIYSVSYSRFDDGGRWWYCKYKQVKDNYHHRYKKKKNFLIFIFKYGRN